MSVVRIAQQRLLWTCADGFEAARAELDKLSSQANVGSLGGPRAALTEAGPGSSDRS